MIRENSVIQNAATEMLQAIESGDKDKCKEALTNYGKAIGETLKSEFESANGDRAILAQRGYRVLTATEQKFYESIIKAGKSDNPKQALMGLPDAVGKVMPVTIIEDVYRDLTESHPLLSRINFQSVEYLTRWILNDHSAKTAVWGAVNSTITTQIASAFKVVEITQCKLSAFALIEKDMLELGPVFLDNYIRTFLKEALLKALEAGIISGTGASQPIGFDRDIHQGVSVTGGAYPQKTAIEVTSFLPAEYGPLLAKLAVTEVYYTSNTDGTVVAASTASKADGSAKSGYTKHGGNMRSFDQVTMICNQVDYLTKVMPATTVLNAAGTYSNNLFPFPTEVIRSNEMTTGKALICLPEEYFMGIGTSKEGTLEYSDDFKFLDDQRVFKIKMHGMGKAYDNTVAILIDISKLDPAYITVLNKTAISAGEAKAE